ncbi:hypothetical protein ACFWJT_15730 [Streptomyces sp. NPDC127069]|uniref:hypothetical protein n=1 Tax=Streptomyces sp. NPDC127069 TaxID=3347128 RepID=UPI0036633582
MSWTDTTPRGKALHWAAVAEGLYRSMTADGGHLAADDKAEYASQIDAAHGLGITDAEIDEHLRTCLSR